MGKSQTFFYSVQTLTYDAPVCLDLAAKDGELDKSAQPSDDGQPLPRWKKLHTLKG